LQKRPGNSRQIAPPDTVPRTATDAFRREAWVLAQPQSHFTVQLLATATDALAQAFIKQHGLSEHAAYVETLSQGTPVFRVIHGSYPSRDLADKAVAALPRTLNASSPWVRSFAEMHKLADRQYAERGAR
jgi:DamX protein